MQVNLSNENAYKEWKSEEDNVPGMDKWGRQGYYCHFENSGGAGSNRGCKKQKPEISAIQ